MPGENAPPIHPYCRCSTAAYEDSKEYDAWLDFLDKGGTTAEWNELKNGKKLSILEPEDKTNAGNPRTYTRKELLQKSRDVNGYLNALGLPQSKWSGKTFIKSIEEMQNAFGIKKASCDIWLREDADIKTVIHEHLHSRSSSWMDKKLKRYRAYEEGTCELLAEEICKQNGLGYTPTYKKYVEPLREFAKLCDQYDSDYDFAMDLFNVDMDKREQWLIELASEHSLQKALKLKSIVRKVKKGNG